MTAVPPGLSNTPAASANPFLGGGASTQSTPQQSDTTRFGLTTTELNTPVTIDLGAPPAGPFGVIYQQPNFDPFGIGVPIQGVSGGDVSVQDMLDYIQSLTPNQISQVQADLATAGYYGAMNSLAKEPVWGSLGNVDFAALGAFAKDAIAAVQGGTTITSMLSLRSQQFATEQQSASTKTPIKDLGKNYTITNLDPNEALNMVDKSAMSVLGTTLPANKRSQMGQWLNQLYTSRQMSADQGDIAQNSLNAEAQAQASDFINPVTGQALDYNGVVAAARSQQGTPYVWGGTTPGQGLDCSGLTQYAYGQNGIQLPRKSQQQWADPKGQNFQDMGQAVPGDLVFFVGGDGTQSAPGHVGIYIGNGMMIDAPHTGSAVRIDNVATFGGLVGFKHYAQINNTSPLAATNLPPGTSPQTSTQSGGTNINNVTDWAQAQLQSMGMPITASNVNFLTSWAQKEGGSFNNTAKFNPLNTTQTAPGSSVMAGGNSAGVQAYSSWAEGLQATAQTLQNYPTIMQALQSGKATEANDAGTLAADFMKWSGQSYSQIAVNNAPSATNPAALNTGDPGAQVAGSEGMDANGGRSIVSTPNTFTQAFDESQQALTDTLDAQIRASDPALANAHDMTNAYTMLAKSLRDGITVNNT